MSEEIETLREEVERLTKDLAEKGVQLERLRSATESDPPYWYRLLKRVQEMSDEEWAAFLKNPPPAPPKAPLSTPQAQSSAPALRGEDPLRGEEKRPAAGSETK